jgi:hypothetical protein
MPKNAVTVSGVRETKAALDGLADDLLPGGAAIRDAGNACAAELVPALRASASASGVPVAPRVARSIKARPGGSVSIGDSTAVGRHGAPAYQLVWGSEHGPAGDPNHFAVPPGPGYWIKPAVDRFKAGPALATFRLSIAGHIVKRGL